MLDLNEKEKHKSLIDTWSKVLSNYNTKNNLSTARQLAYSNNIPQEVRSNVWFIVSGARDLMNANCNIYDDLIEKQPNTKCMKQIEKDYCRSLGSKNMNIKYKHRLRRILIAYSNYNPSVTYTQGMNFIAAFALKQYFEQAPQITIIDDINEETKLENDIINEYWLDCIEEQAFWTFAAIMKKITSLFDDGLVGFHQSVQCFEKLVKHYAPKDLVRHLNTENVYATVCTKWYLTLFTHPGMNENMVKRVWDIFIVEQFDFSVMLKIAYLILIRHKDSLMLMDLTDIMEWCTSKQCFVKDNINDNELFIKAYTLELDDIYLKYVRNIQCNAEKDIEDNNNQRYCRMR